MRTEEPGPATRKQTERSRETTSPAHPDEHERKAGIDDFMSKVDLPGKIDSGPEPDVFGQEIPPQDR